MYKNYIFDTLSKDWWNKNKACQPLHIINNIRFNYIKSKTDINKKNIIDIGCGGGILSEKLALHGAVILGIDKSKDLITLAKNRNKKKLLNIKYINTSLECFAKKNHKNFDVIICMEMIEHLNNKFDLINLINKLSKKHSIIILSSLNKNITTYLYMILSGEYLTKKIQINTHIYENLISPYFLKQCNFKIIDIKGIKYNPLIKYSNINTTPKINYILTLQKK